MPIYSSPSTELYQLGKGVLSIGEWSGATPPSSYTDVGNCPTFTITVTEETLAHYSSRSGTRTKDKEVIIETGYTLEFQLDEISSYNLQMFLKASATGSSPIILKANSELTKEYAVKFKSINPAGPNELWQFWRVKLKPNGAFSLIGDDWSKIGFTGEGLADTANHSDSPYFTVTYGTTTTTTTTAP